MQEATEHRSHHRVEFFRVPTQREHVPVWVFKPADAHGAQAGLVLNLGSGGLQVLTSAELDGDAWEVQLLLGEDDDVPRFRSAVTRIWTRPSTTVGNLTGFRLDDPASSAESFIRTYQAGGADGRWVRCLLFAR